jgi:hypothetical protein
MIPSLTIMQGDALEKLRELPSESVHCCVTCHKPMRALDIRGRPRRFCSRSCGLRYNRVSGGGEGRRHSPETKILLSKLAKRPKPWIRGNRNGMFGKIGSQNPNYIDGSSPQRQCAYASAKWKKIIRKVRRRDGRRCKRCLSGESLHLHHIKPWAGNPELRFNLDNIVTLCAACHRAVHAKGGDAMYGRYA